MKTVAGLGLAALLLGACQVAGVATPAAGEPDFAVVAGADGVALVGQDWLEPVSGLDGRDAGYAGALAVPLDATGAVVLAGGRLAVVRPHVPPVVVDCADCSGLAVTPDLVVTTRKNYTPGNGFDLLLLRHDLTPSRVVQAERLEERSTTDYPGENTASPVTLAADASAVTVGYLARDGGVRRGPSIVARYGLDGKLLASTSVDGVLGRSAVSPDGRHVAVGVGGSAGACITLSSPVVVDTDSLRVRTFTPALPGKARSSGDDSWFFLTDLVWRGGALSATGQLHAPPEGETCDPRPEVWRRDFDTATGTVVDSTGHPATRWNGPGCEDVLTANGDYENPALARRSGGVETRLGGYHQITLGRPRPADCPVP